MRFRRLNEAATRNKSTGNLTRNSGGSHPNPLVRDAVLGTRRKTVRSMRVRTLVDTGAASAHHRPPDPGRLPTTIRSAEGHGRIPCRHRRSALPEPESAQAVSTLFRPGEFYGVPQFGSHSAGFDIHASAATGREDDVQVHTHQDAHFVLVVSGTYLSSARGAPGRARPPTLIFNPPGTTHRDRFAGGVGSFVTVSVPGTAFLDLCTTGRSAGDAVCLRAPSAVGAAFRLARELRGGQDPVILESTAWELFALLAGGSSAAADPQGWVLRAYEAIMDRSADSRLCVRDVAAELDVHPVHLARVFRASWGCSPGELIRWRRVDRAAELLRGTEMPAAEIAAEAGFVDQSHMIRAFRAAYRLTPAAYRRGCVSPIQAPAGRDALECGSP
jgi:AraC family transcriptional regulator